MSAHRYAVFAFTLWLLVYNLLYADSIQSAIWAIIILLCLIFTYLLFSKIGRFFWRLFATKSGTFLGDYTVKNKPNLCVALEPNLSLAERKYLGISALKITSKLIRKTSQKLAGSATVFIVLLLLLLASFQVYSKISVYQNDNRVITELSSSESMPWLVACVKNQQLNERYQKLLLTNVRVYEYDVLNNIKLMRFIDKFQSISGFYYNLDANLSSLISPNNKLYLYQNITSKPLKVIGNSDKDVDAKSCAVWRVKLKPIYGVVNQYGFDYQKWAFSKQIIASASAKEPYFVFDNSAWQSALYNIRHDLSMFIQDNTSEISTYSFFKALLLGDRTALSKQQKSDFQSMGIAHIIAISGLHLGTLYVWVLSLIYGLVYLLTFLMVYLRAYAQKNTQKFTHMSVLKFPHNKAQEKPSKHQIITTQKQAEISVQKRRLHWRSMRLKGGVFFKAINRFIHSRFVHSQILKHWLAIFFVLAYALLTGWQLPAQRTWIMLLVASLLMSFQLRHSLLTVLSLALIYILLENPLAAIDVSLHMSVMALVIIFLSLYFRVYLNEVAKKFINKPIKSRQFSEQGEDKGGKLSSVSGDAYEKRLSWHNLKQYLDKIKVYFLGYFRLQWWFFFLMLPLTTFWLSEVSLFSYIYNVITIATVLLLIFPLGLLSLLFHLLGWDSLAVLLLQGSEYATQQWWHLLQFIQSQAVNFAGINNTDFALSLPWWWLMLIILLLLALCYYRQKWLLLSFALFFAVSIDWLYLDVFSSRGKMDGELVNGQMVANSGSGEFSVNVMDVGQGLAVVVSTRSHRLIYDVGAAYPSGFSYYNTVIKPNGKRADWFPIDTLVLSHNDNDHAGGFDSFLDEAVKHKSAAKISIVVPSAHVPQYKEKVAVVKSMYVNACHGSNSRQWQWDGVAFAFLSTANIDSINKPKIKENNRSCILRISSAFGSILIPGDIEWQVELALVKLMPNKLASDILIAPHHGSTTSSSHGFIAAVNPDSVIYSTAMANRYNHPHPKISKRYKNAGVKQYNTACLGQLAIDFNAQGYKITSWKNKLNRIWHKDCQ